MLKGMDYDIGDIDINTVIEVGEYISKQLKRQNQSKVSLAKSRL